MLYKNQPLTQTARGVPKLLKFIFPRRLQNFLSLDQADAHFTELLRGGSGAFLIRTLGIAIGYIFTLLITRNYGPEAMGVFALSQTVLMIVSMAARLGLDTASLRFMAEYSAHDQWGRVKDVYLKSLKLLLPTSLGFALLFYYLSPFMADYLFSKPNMAPAFKIMSLSLVPFVFLCFHSENLRALRKIAAYAFFTKVSIPLVAAAILVVMIYHSNNIIMPVIAYAIGTLILSILCLGKWLSFFKISQVEVETSLSYKDMLSVSLSMLLASSMLYLMQWTNIFILGIFGTEAEVGIFNVALKLSFFTSITLFAINSIAAPKFAMLYSTGDLKGLGRLAQQSNRIIFWTSLPILLSFLIFPALILGFFGPEFRTGSFSLMILTLGLFLNAISGSVAFILIMTGRQKIFQNIMICSVVFNIILNLYLIPRFGINGAAFAYVAALAFVNLSSVYYIKKELQIFTIYLPFFPGERGEDKS
jgi:O-antigen/teichoic acid export membrane protein